MPEEIDFRTQPQLARVMVERAVEGEFPSAGLLETRFMAVTASWGSG